jgi:FkbM family methyltransferase
MFLKEIFKIYSRNRRSYARAGDDCLLNRMFRKKKGKGFYVDVGAYHPTDGSNTYFFYKRGWRGITIEPNRRNRFLFKICRPKDTHITCGVSNQEGEYDYYMFSKPGLNTIDSSVAKKKNSYLIQKTKIPVLTLSYIFEKNSVSNIDLLSVDTEGNDLNVLESNDWNKWKPRVIIVEDKTFDLECPENSDIYKFLSNKGYRLSSTILDNLVFKLINQN